MNLTEYGANLIGDKVFNDTDVPFNPFYVLGDLQDGFGKQGMNGNESTYDGYVRQAAGPHTFTPDTTWSNDNAIQFPANVGLSTSIWSIGIINQTDAGLMYFENFASVITVEQGFLLTWIGGNITVVND